MKFLAYFLLGIFCFFSADFIATNYASEVGAGFNEMGMVTSSISLLIAVVVVCTAIMWHKIDSLKK